MLSAPVETDWKCRECGFTNKDKDNTCETCKSVKPMRPCIGVRTNYSERSLSNSPVDRRSLSPENDGVFYNRDAKDNSKACQGSSINETLPSNKHSSDHEESRPHLYAKSRGHDQSSDAHSPEKDRRKSTAENRSYAPKSFEYANRDPSFERKQGASHGNSRRFQEGDGERMTPKSKSLRSSDEDSDDSYEKSRSKNYPKSSYSSSRSFLPDDNVKFDKMKQEATGSNSSTKGSRFPEDSTKTSSYQGKDDEHDKYEANSLDDATISKGSSKNTLVFQHSPSHDRKGSGSSITDDIGHKLTDKTATQMGSEKVTHMYKGKQKNPSLVYIPDLPPNIDDSRLLEDKIRQCLQIKHKQEVLDVKCNLQLGIGIIYLQNDEEKHHLTKNIQQIIIDSWKNTIVSLVDELELISYIVVHLKNTNVPPCMNDICQQWARLTNRKSEPKCEQVSILFPNIFRIVTHSLEELIEASSVTEFAVNDQLASVYYRADCCFFEDLPRATTEELLKRAVEDHISRKYTLKTFMHIQYNSKCASAIVLTCNKARVWKSYTSIQLDGRSYMKKDNLACRLLIKPVPKGITETVFRNHSLFEDKVVNAIIGDGYAIIELSDRLVFQKCTDLGAIRIGDALLHIDTYSSTSCPENSEIDAKSWYETEMQDHKPDIMPFVSNQKHDIFRLKWNAKAFLEQFQRWQSTDAKLGGKDHEKREKQCNLQRHLLRMTVMLNTIGVVKRGFYRIGDKEIKLQPERLKTVLYDHKSILKLGHISSLSRATDYPFKSTVVRVVNKDCLMVYKDMISEGYHPVLLNMANATSPGGGYKRGDGAQEETLFRRSNYYQSLDLALDDEKPTLRFYCDKHGQLEPMVKGDELYPMDEFGAIYTSGLTVFRNPEETGYEFMDIPMCDVCSIAMAAYRDPQIENGILTSKFSIGTRKKLENIFAIAHHHKHDSLVLSAFGCGAFRNPPNHLAVIFKSVIEQYAGYFKCICFAIIDDHNTRQELNPTGNFIPFEKLLGRLELTPKHGVLADMMIGPWRILKKTADEITLSDVRIRYLTPCFFGGKCTELKDEKHCREYLHPPLCPYTSSKEPCNQKDDSQHMLWFKHRQKCPYGGECELIDKDRVHTDEFEHPMFCRDGGHCEEMDSKHLQEFRHVPICRDRRSCPDYVAKSTEHCQRFRHNVAVCRFGSFCVKFHDGNHTNEESHPFAPACPFTPFHCRLYDQLCQAKNISSLPNDIRMHCAKYSHVCRFGRQCHEKSDIHWKTTVHVARSVCPLGDTCTKRQEEDHLNSFTHPNVADIRLLCPYSTYECRNRRDREHILKFRHNKNQDRSGIISCFGQNNDIDFVKNQQTIIAAIQKYMKDTNKKQSFWIPSEIQSWVKVLQPVHRCSNVIFESILVHGHVMSREHMEHLKNPHFAAQAVQQHKRVRAVLDHNKSADVEDTAKSYIQAIVCLEYSKKYGSTHSLAGGGTSLPEFDKNEETIKKTTRLLKSNIGENGLNAIKQCALDIAEASWNLHNAPTGIKYEPDKVLGTDKHIFSILGPHLGHYYGDIFLVFKSEIMLHPDANFSPQAATSFASKSTFGHRPWVTDPGNDADRVKCFHESKLHCAVSGYEYAAAAELMAVTGLRKNIMDSDLKNIISRWKNVDSHQTFEGHLPQLVPLDYVEEVYIPKSIFDSMATERQEMARKIFRGSLRITKHEIDSTAMGGGGPQPADKGRLAYQDYVVDELVKRFDKRKENSKTYQGFWLTLEPTQFSDHIVLPLTISAARDQYIHTRRGVSNSDETYIYWEAMYGDMMVSLANEPISPNEDQPHLCCLVCYIAERPLITSENYSESYTYVNAGDPFRHQTIKHTGRCSSKSRTFHRGSDVENFLTYRIKLEYKNGKVTLSHAGPNSIYCLETVAHQFSRATLDLNKLNYIHVSAGFHKVPIRNLQITFKPIEDLQPSFDKSFKRGDKPLLDRRTSPRRSRSPTTHSKPVCPDEASPSFLGKAKDVIRSFFGLDEDDERPVPCPYSKNCLLQESSKHLKEYTHPCPSGKHCQDRSSNHRKQYSHNDQHQPIDGHGDRKPHEPSADKNHAIKEAACDNERSSDKRIPCRHGSDCYDRSDPIHCSKYSHPHERRAKSPMASNFQLTPCRHGRDCRDQNNSQHCAKFSHPNDGKPSSLSNWNHERIPCRHGRDCWDQNNSQHCEKFSHPNDNRRKN